MPVPLTHATPELTFIQVGGRKISTCEVSDEATEPDPGIVSAAAERVFSLLKLMFGDTQMSALADMIQAALMLNYNARKVG